MIVIRFLITIIDIFRLIYYLVNFLNNVAYFKLYLFVYFEIEK